MAQEATLTSINVLRSKQVMVLNPFSVTSLHLWISNLINWEHPRPILINLMSLRSAQQLTYKGWNLWQSAITSSPDPIVKQILWNWPNITTFRLRHLELNISKVKLISLTFLQTSKIGSSKMGSSENNTRRPVLYISDQNWGNFVRLESFNERCREEIQIAEWDSSGNVYF